VLQAESELVHEDKMECGISDILLGPVKLSNNQVANTDEFLCEDQNQSATYEVIIRILVVLTASAACIS
jgi:hypothetical protein